MNDHKDAKDESNDLLYFVLFIILGIVDIFKIVDCVKTVRAHGWSAWFSSGWVIAGYGLLALITIVLVLLFVASKFGWLRENCEGK